MTDLKARDPNRIPMILKVIEKLWNQHPDLRLGQLINNLASMERQDAFFLEDSELTFLAAVVYTNGWGDLS